MRFPPYIWGGVFINNNFSYAIFPLGLIYDEKYQKLSSDEKLLYVLLLNRTNYSKKNLNFFCDKDGIFVYYSNVQIQKQLNCSGPTAVSLLKKLESAGLIRKEYQKRGLPLKIYVNDVFGIHKGTYNKTFTANKPQDKPVPKYNNNFQSPALYKEKETSFDIEKTRQQANDGTLDFGKMKNKKRRHTSTFQY